MPLDQSTTADVDLTSDLGDQSQQQVADTPQGGRENAEAPQSVRDLLEQASGLKEDAQGRLRTDDGKFAAKPPEGTQQGTEQTQGTEQQGQQQQVSTEQVQLIPEYQQLISGLPAEVQETVRAGLVARETAIANYVQEVQARVSGYAAIENVIAPRRQAWAMAGTNPETAITQLFALSDFATRDARGFLEWFAGNNNIDLSELGETYVPPDPQYAALQGQVAQLTGIIQNMQNGAVNTAHQQFVGVVQQFEGTVDPTTNQPKYPHFNAVAEDMLALVPAIRQANPGMGAYQILEQAYDRAVYANPTTRALVLQANNAQTAAAEAERVRRAAAAGQSLAGTAPSHESTLSPVQQADSVRGALEAAFAQHS